MDLVSKADLERDESGSHFIPDSVLVRLHPEVKFDASAAFSKMVMENPDYQFRMVYDAVEGGLTVYWYKTL